MKIKLKDDKYRRKRGGKAFLIRVYCIRCGREVLLYQKDGDGLLKRCYLNRIFSPPELERLQYEGIKNLKDMANLICVCGSVIGTPMLHHDGRLAFKLRFLLFFRKRVTHQQLQQMEV